MSINPALVAGYGGELLPAPFQGEYIACRRDGMEICLDGVQTSNGKWKAKGVLYLSNFRLVFVSNKEDPSGLRAFDIPLAYIRKEKFNQPIFGCNHLAGLVWPVGAGLGPGGTAPPHGYQIYFKEGGAGTLLPIYFNLLFRARPNEDDSLASASQTHVATFSEVNKMVHTAFVDPSDPTKVFLSQPVDETQRLSSEAQPIYAANYGKEETYQPMT